MRTVVTGIGIISSIGKNKQEVIESIKSEKSGIDKITLFDHSAYECKYGAEIKNYNPYDYFNESEVSNYNRVSQFSIIAIKEALKQADLDLKAIDSNEVGLCHGTSHGALEELFDIHKIFLDKKAGKVDSGNIFRSEYYGLLKHIATYFNITGPGVLTSIACASGANAIGMATDFIRNRKAKYVICGGSDEFEMPTFAGFWGLHAISPNPTQPFSTGKPGITLGEGAAYFIVESLETAKQRGAQIIGEVLGYALTNDAYHVTAPHPKGVGACRCMNNAVKNSGIEKDDIEYINTHGTGTNANDLGEKNAIVSFYDRNTEKVPPISATKTYTGHATGASGAIEFALCMLCMQNGILPPTLNFEQSRFAEDLDFIPNKVREKKIKTFISNSFGFAGCNVALIGSEFDENKEIKTPVNGDRRVVITGIGGISSVGVGKEEIWQAFKDKRVNISKIDQFELNGSRCTHAALVKNLDPKKYTRRLDVRRMDRLSLLATLSVHLCLADSKYKLTAKNKDDVGIFYAVTPGSMQGRNKHFESLILKGPEHPSQIDFPYSTRNASLGQICVNLGIGGYSTNLVEGSSGLGAVILSYDAVKNGYQNKIITGGSDELYWNYHKSYEILGELISDRTLKNGIDQFGMFAPESIGYIPGEGSAFIMLDSFDSAKNDNLEIYGEIVGSGLSMDSNPQIHNETSGINLYRAMFTALNEAGISPDQIGIVLSSDRGIASVALAELSAMKKIFQSHLNQIVYTTSRFNTGWLNASSDIFNVISLLHAFNRENILPVPVNGSFRTPDDFITCKDIIPSGEIEYGMVLKVSREGNNSAVIIKRSC